ncbi:ATP-binding cassette domain-containing protein [Peptoniphilus sp. KCTC 25270]|uniref:ATP-binding cassette domain-containing protein n=1 Tax=Peptoniphilus sp. KCTC 25270 TaxID=2897414 RepID=UPI001E3AA9EF|nr:ATP-binding cassette domain-containing protein [Peptoniphilus sp. KCTC 25270]
MRFEGKNIQKNFDGNNVLNSVNFSLMEPAIVALVGRNGSGKTTLLRILFNELKMDEGSLLYERKEMAFQEELFENISYLPDHFDYFKYDKIKDALYYYEVVYPNFDREFFLQELEKHHVSLEDRIGKLSKGMNKLVGLLMVLSTKAKILLLDELFDGLDVLNRQVAFDFIIEAYEEGRTIFLSSHELGELQGIATDIFYLNKEGILTETKADGSLGLLKFQVVTPSVLPEEILSKVVLRSKIGRVYTLLAQGTQEEWDKIFQQENVIQYDVLPVKMEDLFYWDKGREEHNERI